ncbi:Predicted nuclease, contains PIN domain, potential toxin-antitoxin system component [Desulfonatronum zhilinae]|nr:Predicted nuclease, contains PIN domain, potential toxin-antitoxin system component [Desulfonatronum zhilinae]
MIQAGLKFLVDVSTGKAVETYLRSKGHDVRAVRDIDSRMEDEEIIRLAVDEQRMIVTMDKDFGELVYHCLMKHFGILLLRLENETSAEKLRILKYILENHSSQLQNNFCVFYNDKLRVRPCIATRIQA